MYRISYREKKIICPTPTRHPGLTCPPLPDEGLVGAGASAEGGGDGAAAGGAPDAGDRARAAVPGGGEASGRSAAPAASQGPGQSSLGDQSV